MAEMRDRKSSAGSWGAAVAPSPACRCWAAFVLSFAVSLRPSPWRHTSIGTPSKNSNGSYQHNCQPHGKCGPCLHS